MTTNKINYKEIIPKYPWLVERDQYAIISPDADGMICGLFMAKYLDWSIVGYYDNGKYLIIKNGVSARDCVFLDTEIYRKEVKSCGHHIVLYRNNELPSNWGNFSNCFNPNILRMRSRQDDFRLKYPMATIHLLLAIIGQEQNISLPDDAVFPIMQADGTINRFLDRHTGNLLDWLEYLDAFNKNNTLYKLIHRKIDLVELSKEYVDYVDYYVKNKKDKIPISNNSGLIESSFNKSLSSFSEESKKQIQEYLKFIADKTGWDFVENEWLWDQFKTLKFTKKTCRPGVRTYNKAAENNFLSLAITKNDTMEYTIEEPDKLP